LEVAALKQKIKGNLVKLAQEKGKKNTHKLWRYSYLGWSPSLLLAIAEDFHLRAVAQDFLGGLGKSSLPVKLGLSWEVLVPFFLCSSPKVRPSSVSSSSSSLTGS
jgi:hypothetical protein